mmetsp:Transcript_19077/g.31245  ORF Transcript_19077/g.31245 Transcript_19077/m.31245 type:complete len:733 (+) Transcript_19077:103-2301(+)
MAAFGGAVQNSATFGDEYKTLANNDRSRRSKKNVVIFERTNTAVAARKKTWGENDDRAVVRPNSDNKSPHQVSTTVASLEVTSIRAFGKLADSDEEDRVEKVKDGDCCRFAEETTPPKPFQNALKNVEEIPKAVIGSVIDLQNRIRSKAGRPPTESQILNRMKIMGEMQLCVAVFGISIMIVAKELRWANGEIGYFATDVLKSIISASILVLVVLVHRYYGLKLQLLTMKNIVPKTVSIFSSGLLVPYLFELLICCVHVPPFVNSTQGYRWENLLSVLMFAKIYIFVRVLSLNSTLHTSAGRFIGVLTNVESSTYLVIKIALANNPRRFMFCSFALLLSISSYSVFIFERSAALDFSETTDSVSPDDRRIALMQYGNVLWMMFITVLTVGYGDLFPYTPEGRVCTLIAAAFGVCCTALLIALIHNQLELTQQEIKLVKFLQKDWIRKAVKLKAVRCLQASWRYYLAKARARDRKQAHTWMVRLAERAMYRELASWRELKRTVSRFGGHDNLRQVTVIDAIYSDLRDLTDRLETDGIIVAEREEEEGHDALPSQNHSMHRSESLLSSSKPPALHRTAPSSSTTPVPGMVTSSSSSQSAPGSTNNDLHADSSADRRMSFRFEQWAAATNQNGGSTPSSSAVPMSFLASKLMKLNEGLIDLQKAVNDNTKRLEEVVAMISNGAGSAVVGVVGEGHYSRGGEDSTAASVVTSSKDLNDLVRRMPTTNRGPPDPRPP